MLDTINASAGPVSMAEFKRGSPATRQHVRLNCIADGNWQAVVLESMQGREYYEMRWHLPLIGCLMLE
jgi:hypothetical protein